METLSVSHLGQNSVGPDRVNNNTEDQSCEHGMLLSVLCSRTLVTCASLRAADIISKKCIRKYYGIPGFKGISQ